MFKKANYTLLLVLFALLFFAGCKTHIYSLNPCINTVDVITEQAGNTQTTTAIVTYGNIQFDITSPIDLAQSLNMQLKVKSVQDNAGCEGRQEEVKNRIYSFSGIVPVDPHGEPRLDAFKDFSKTNSTSLP